MLMIAYTGLVTVREEGFVTGFNCEGGESFKAKQSMQNESGRGKRLITP